MFDELSEASGVTKENSTFLIIFVTNIGTLRKKIKTEANNLGQF